MNFPAKKVIFGALFGLTLAGFVTACVGNDNKGPAPAAPTPAENESEQQQSLAALTMSNGNDGAVNTMTGSNSPRTVKAWKFAVTSDSMLFSINIGDVSTSGCANDSEIGFQFQIQLEDGTVVNISPGVPVPVPVGTHKFTAIAFNNGLCQEFNMKFVSALTPIRKNVKVETPNIVGGAAVDFQKYECQYSLKGSPRLNKTFVVQTAPFRAQIMDGRDYFNSTTMTGQRISDGKLMYCGLSVNNALCISSPNQLSNQSVKVGVDYRCLFNDKGQQKQTQVASLEISRLNGVVNGRFRCSSPAFSSDQIYDLTNCQMKYDHGRQLPLQLTQAGQIDLEVQYSKNRINIAFQSALTADQLNALGSATISWNVFNADTDTYLFGNNLLQLPANQLSQFQPASIGFEQTNNNGLPSIAKQLKSLQVVFGVQTGNQFRAAYVLPLNQFCDSNPELFRSTNGAIGCPGN